jgi:2,4-dienoyl-CoA reductase (NADPH2)
VKTNFNVTATVRDLVQANFDEVVLATGVTPRRPAIDGIDNPNVLSYVDVLLHKKPLGRHVAIIGAGGIGFDVAVYVTQHHSSTSLDRNAFLQEWGVDINYEHPGGLLPLRPAKSVDERQVCLLQRKTSKIGETLGKTTGWIHRITLKQRNVAMINGVTYRRIDDKGLHITHKNEPKLLAVDTIIICAGQEPVRDLKDELEKTGMPVHLIGGADRAVELDAKRAIEQGAKLAAAI